MYLDQDPLAWARPFPTNPTAPIWAHWHEIVGAALLYSVIQWASPSLCKRYVGAAYTGLSAKTRLNFDIHVVSMVQCIASVVLLVPTWYHPHFQNRAADPYSSLYGYNGYNGFVSAVTVGYFVWDLYVCLRHIRLFGAGFLLHAFAALFVFTNSFRPYCMPWVPAFLLFELSTPFVNINWFASRLPAGTFSDRAVAINGVFLLVTFFLVRIVWGIYAVGMLARDMWQVWRHDHWFFPVATLTLNFALDALNVYWFLKMLAIAKKRLLGAKTSGAKTDAKLDAKLDAKALDATLDAPLDAKKLQ